MRDVEERRKWRLEKKFKKSGVKSKDEPPLGLGNCATATTTLIVVVSVIVETVILVDVSDVVDVENILDL